MKIGAEDKKKVIAMGVLLVIAIPLLLRTLMSTGSTPAPPVAAPPAKVAAPQSEAAKSAPKETALEDAAQKKSKIPKVRENTLDPTLRMDILDAAQKIEYSGGSRNIFHIGEAPVTVAKVDQSVRQQTIPAPNPILPPPPPPPIPLKYFGFSNRAGEAKKAFLQDGENTFVEAEGGVVERRYKIVKITNNSVLVEDVLNNHQQSINLPAAQAN
jgi:hypothetical protein